MRMKVFLSYAPKDRSWARKLASRLEAEGLQVWFGERELLPGDNWAIRAGEALAKSDAMVVLLSPDSVESPWVRNEIQYALGSTQFRGRLVPVVVRPTKKIPWILEELPTVYLKKGLDAGQQIVDLLKKRKGTVRASAREAR